jgi:predicted site-specific integrase-resolvase
MNATRKTFVTTRVASRHLGVAATTLRKWADNGTINYIRTPGGKRLYEIDQLIPTNQETQSKQSICYCRVSSNGQKEDLQRQIQYMQNKFPNHTIMYDIGSGINFNRKSLRTILELSSKGLVKEVVVAYRDRLCRFAFELCQWFFHLHGVKLMVLNETMDSSANSELAEDLLAIINVFNCRVNGKRKYKTKKDSKQLQEQENKEGKDSSQQSQEV